MKEKLEKRIANIFISGKNKSAYIKVGCRKKPLLKLVTAFLAHLYYLM
jgi:hypothetical protein